MRFTKVPAFAAGLALLAGAAAGCASENATGTAGDQIKVLYLLPTLSDEAYTREQAGAKAQAKQYKNLALTVDSGTGRQDATAFIAKIQNAVTRKYDAIAVDAGGNGPQLAPALEAARKAGVKVVTVGQPIAQARADSHVQFDQSPAYTDAGRFMSAQLPSGGDIGIITCVASNADSQARVNGFKAGLAPNIKVVAFADAQCEPAKARTISENMLTAHAGLRGVFNSTDIATIGTIEALRAAGKDLVVIGGDGQTANLRHIAGGNVQDGAVRYPSETIGALGVKTAHALASGETVPREVAVPRFPLITKENAAAVLAQIKAIESGAQAPTLNG
ncbi:D-ribose ABC transporter substrate-binding protein [Actinomadura viridis]|uniref:Ribose transport system substrate-binding protein n=1 Tax=Actinomadura viridis TaxID=58110 RepID=A0A931DKD5_9ACTN|nr:sugar ABC transporter substrate-binding protein [Actinomadura viridis]MBG6091057.1 ribose transport system substrate-binding protein [Actinomadura viridis]